MKSRTDVSLSWLLERRRTAAWVLAFLLGLAPASLRAEASERLEQAKSLFREGNALLAAGDPERALERFLASRDAVASGKNTANAAICLERLSRYDEALEMYEELLARFSADLDEQDRQNLVPIMARLRAGLGSLDISSNVQALVIIDGKARGTLPRIVAIRALPGKRRLRVVKEGYRTFDASIDVGAGESVAVDASLEPLSGSGAFRVELAGDAAETRLFVDGQPVGSLPWEGTVRVGPHLLQALRAARGSKPFTVDVVERKTRTIRVGVATLGGPVRFVAWPPTAKLWLDDVALGHGSWSGRLPLGSYLLRAEEDGYFPGKTRLEISTSSGPSNERLELVRDAKSTRWPQRSPFRFATGVGVAFFYAPTLKGGTEAACPRLCQGSPAATGGRIEGAFEVTHELGVGAELAGGYFAARQAFTRAAFANGTSNPPTHVLQQQLALGGGYVRLAAVSRLKLPRALSLRSALGFGLLAASYEGGASGVALTSGPELIEADGFGYTRISELMTLVTAGLRLERTLGSWQFSVGIETWFVPKNGPRFPDVDLAVPPSCRSAVGCPPPSNLLGREPVHGPFVAVLAEAAVRYRF